jgi:hypothetical protein
MNQKIVTDSEIIEKPSCSTSRKRKFKDNDFNSELIAMKMLERQ